MNNLKTLGIFFIVFYGIAVVFDVYGVRNSVSPFTVDALIAASGAFIAAFILQAMRGNRRK